VNLDDMALLLPTTNDGSRQTEGCSDTDARMGLQGLTMERDPDFGAQVGDQFAAALSRDVPSRRVHGGGCVHHSLKEGEIADKSLAALGGLRSKSLVGPLEL
jgi:hypothetical protein